MTPLPTSLSPNKQALLKIRALKQQLAATAEPIAVVSMACRFPRHADTPEKFWQSLLRQEDLVGDIPDDRWDLDAFYDEDPEVPGRMYARKGVFLDDLAQIDPEFFGISPREATWVDPQQRLLMEVGWEALERAGWIPQDISETTGVFVGWMHNDYQNEASDSFLNLNPYIATGAAGSFLSGRLAYALGLQGPSVAIDTACSSSLVALHLAIQSLQRGDCDQALVGGVNAICSPTTNILTCKLKALSPSGHSRAFDAAADGYLRGEGCGVVALRRLSDAQGAGDSILGIIRGSAIGHNGTGGGLTVPNPQAQEKIIRQALQRSGHTPGDVDYLEAHGTGTSLGDPIEVNAAAAAYGEGRDPERPLLMGSVKTNIGHLEAAAGMAGLIKVLLSLQKGTIPGQMHFDTPNPHVAWDRIPIKVLTHESPWPRPQRRIAGVSAFGMSGTNAHVILEAPRPADSPSEASREFARAVRSSDRPECLITLSGKCAAARQELAANYAAALAEDPHIDLEAFARQTNVARSHFEHRAAVVVASRDQAIADLNRFARGSAPEQVFVGSARRAPRVAWQFTGQGAQYVGMGQQLYAAQPVFRDVIDWCDEQLRSCRSGSLREVLFEDTSAAPRVDHTEWTQPALFALQMGLAKLLQDWNVWPDIVLGHSVGQYAAACVAGILRWEDGLHLIAERGKLIGALPQEGVMLAVFAPADVVRSAIAGFTQISLAAENGTHVVVSGCQKQVASVQQSLSQSGIKSRPLTTSHAFHSPLMDPVLEPFASVADTLSFHPPERPLICNISGEVLPPQQVLDGAYWARHIRAAVAYEKSIATLEAMGCELLVELGPQPVLTRMAAAGWSRGSETRIACLQRKGPSPSLVEAVGRLYAQGVTPDFRRWHGMAQGTPIGPVTLPTYPFQRKRYWGPDKPRAAHAEHHSAHPLLGTRLALAGASGEERYQSYIDVDSPAWMADHEVFDACVLPGAAFVELALAAAENRVLRNVVFEHPVRPHGRTALQTVVRDTAAQTTQDEEPASSPATADVPAKGDVAAVRRALATYVRADDTEEWRRHFTCELDNHAQTPGVSPAPAQGEAAVLDLQAIHERLVDSASPEAFYDKMQDVGLRYGPAFQCIQSLEFSETEVLARLSVVGDLRGYQVPPTLLDAALHSLAAGLLRSEDMPLFLPVGIGAVQLHSPAIDADVWGYARWKQTTGDRRTADVMLARTNGEVLLVMSDVCVQAASAAALRQLSGAGPSRLTYEIQWAPGHLSSETVSAKHWLVVRTEDDAEESRAFQDRWTQAMTQRGHRITEIRLGETRLAEDEAGPAATFSGEDAQQWKRLFSQLGGTGNDAPPFDGAVWWCSAKRRPPTAAPREDAPCGDAVAVDSESAAMIHFLQAMIGQAWRRLPCGIQFITRDAVATAPDAPVDPEQTKRWGFARVVAAEQPELRVRLLDVAAADREQDTTLDVTLDVTLAETTDNQHRIEGGQLWVPRMRPAAGLGRGSSFEAREDGCYLITGGLGRLGRHAARWLADHGAGQVVLVSRRAPDASVGTFVQACAANGCDVVIHAADMSAPDQVARLFSRFGNDLLPLRGVVHAAGVLDDARIESLTTARFENVLQPKIEAARLLHQFTQDRELDLFLLYSSAASVLGSPGQSNYAMGNAYLDGLAHQRRAAGLPALSINWGPWTEGMADDPRVLKRLAFQGIAPLTVAEAHGALDDLLSRGAIQATVIDADWRKMRGPQGEIPELLCDLVGTRGKTRAAVSALVHQLRELQGTAQRERLVTTLQQSLQRILTLSEPPETDRPLIEMGLDSLMAVEFGTELQQSLGDGFNVGPTMLFDHPTIDAIGDHVLTLVNAETSDATPLATEAATTGVPASNSQDGPSTVAEEIAVIGMSCRFPGARDVREFWGNLVAGVDAVGPIPEDRWEVERFYCQGGAPGKMPTREGGFVDDIGDFDAAFFNIGEQEACWIDPQHRLLLENSYRALEDAGIPADSLTDPRVGVFMGMMGSDYAFLPSLDDRSVIEGFQGAGLSHSAGVGRISYHFGFEGPCVAVDTASSSSLVAVYQAMRSLQEGQCHLALAGGVNAILAPVNSLLMSQVGLLSPDGRCKSFSKSADGFGRGEGCGVVALKRLSDAQRDGNRILAVIRGGAVEHNGASGGITAPSGKAQVRLMEAALRDAGIVPAQVQYLEAHGTGTEFGDPMELGAAAKVYGKGRRQDQPLLVGSVKANISHLEAAGGVSGLIKTVLALQHGLLPRQLHFEEPSPHVPWSRMPLQVVTQNTRWPKGDRPTAGISALGLAGTNAHLVVSAPEAISPDESSAATPIDGMPQGSTEPTPILLPLSARCPSALQQLCRDYADFLDQAADVPWDDFCYTVAAGRRHWETRRALIVDSREDALRQLRQAIGPDSAAPPVSSPPRVAWVFGNACSADSDSLRSLVQAYPRVRKFWEDCEDRWRRHAGATGTLEEACRTPGVGPPLANYLWQAALCQLWTAWGLQPDVAAGWGTGQYVAACVAGCLCYLDALILIYEQAPRREESVSEPLPEAELDAFEQIADAFNYYPPHLPLLCSLSGDQVPPHRSLGGAYWRQQVTAETSLASIAGSLAATKANVCLAAGVSATTTHLKELFPGRNGVLSVDGSVPRSHETILGALAGLYEAGGQIDFAQMYDASPRTLLSLPNYPFQKKRYWITEIGQYMQKQPLEVSTPQ